MESTTKPISETEKYTGIIKFLDFQGIGYILPDAPNLPELYITPLSISSTNNPIILQEGDRVKFNIKFTGSNSISHSSFEVVNLTPFGVKCNNCKKFGHFSWKCAEKDPLLKCFRCGLSGHRSSKCDQKIKGWFSNGDNKSYRRGVGYGNGGGGYCVNGWRSLFGESKGVGSRPRSKKSVVCVKRKEDVKKVEEVEDCFILEFDPSVNDDDDDLRSIVCVKKKEDVKKVEKLEDCFILEFDPSDELEKFLNLSICEKKSDVVAEEDDDVTIVAVRGKVACRDYPHPRHLCVTHPFKKAPKDIHCKMCYCYICDIPAPCRKWNVASMDSCLSHCYATDESPFWRNCKDLSVYM